MDQISSVNELPLRPEAPDPVSELKTLTTSGKPEPLQNECCVICLGDISQRCEAIPCRHRNFDYQCLVTWLGHREICPLCQANVTEVRNLVSDGPERLHVYKVQPRPQRQAQSSVAVTRLTESHSVPEEAESYRSLNRPPNIYSTRLGCQPRRQSPAARLSRCSPPESDSLAQRREIYRRNLYSRHVGSNSRQPELSRRRELSSQLFMTDPDLVSRAKMWLRRELLLFDFLSGTTPKPNHFKSTAFHRIDNREFLIEYIVAILKSVDIQSSDGKAETMIGEFLGKDSSRLFLHELKSWLRSPCRTLSAWDRVVQYGGANRDGQSPSATSTWVHSDADLYPDRYIPRYRRSRKREIP